MLTKHFRILACAAAVVPATIGAPVPCLTDESVTGYNDWTTLKSDMESGFGETYTLCPETEFDAETPGVEYPWISIDVSMTLDGATIQCGSDGKVTNNCVINGGRYHFKVGGWANDIVMNGITFKGSYYCSIHVGWLFAKSLVFNDCLWTGNVDRGDGDWGFLNFQNSGGGMINLNRCEFKNNVASQGGRLVRVGDESHDTEGSVSFSECIFEENEQSRALVKVGYYSVASFEGCTFRRNTIDGSIVYTNNGRVNFASCLFDDNDVTEFVLAVAFLGVFMVIRDSCFINNRIGTGIIMRLGYYVGYSNHDNFAEGNTPGCDFYKFTDYFQNEGVCYEFTAGECSVPTAAPVGTPSPITPAPITMSPTTTPPTTEAPIPFPITASPTTEAPTPSPITAPPTTEGPSSSPITGPTTTDAPTQSSITAPPITAPPVPALPVPAPTPPPCFSAEATVQVYNKAEPVPMKHVKVGDRIVTRGDQTNKDIYQPVYAFGHMDKITPTLFLQIYTKGKSKAPLEITGAHLVFVESKRNPVRADSIQVDDVLQGDGSDEGGGLEVQAISFVKRNGAYAPLTTGGTLMVDGIRASSYISLQDQAVEYVEMQHGVTVMSQHDFIHMVLSPFRMLVMLTGTCRSINDDGMPYYIGRGIRLLKWLDSLELHLLLQLLLLSVLCLFGLCFAVETFGPTVLMVAVVSRLVTKIVGIKTTGK